MKAKGQKPHIAELEGVNPLLGTAIVTTQEKIDHKREALVAYLRSVDQSMRAVMDPDQVDALIPKVAGQFDVPGMDDPTKAKPMIAAIASRGPPPARTTCCATSRNVGKKASSSS